MAKVSIEKFSKEDAQAYVDGIADKVLPALEEKGKLYGLAETVDVDELVQFVSSLNSDQFNALGTLVGLAAIGII